jgi:5-(carboxyamino)imidazole ribonucleotide mutase
MAAHLAGAIKANCTLPVVGVPLKGGMMDGMDALLSTVQMPKGVPVATMAVGKAGIINAAILSAEILSISDDSLVHKLANFKTAGSKL